MPRMMWHPLRRVLELLETINQKADLIMSEQTTQQADINAATTALTSLTSAVNTVATDLAAAEANIKAEIAALQAANPAVDTTALNAAVAGIAAPLAALQAADTSIDALETPAPAPSGG